MNKLERLIDKSGPYLVVEAGEATLSRDPPTLTGEALCIMNLREAFDGFRQKFARGQSEFNAMDLSKISGGQHYAAVQRWQDGGMIAPHRLDGRERLFDLQTAFVAGVLGSLVRAGQDRTVLLAVAQLLGVAAKKKEAVA